MTVHQFLPDFGAGTEILTFETAKELKKRGHDIVIWTGYPTGESRTVDQYEYDGLSVYRYYFNPVEAAIGSNLMEVEYNNRQFEQHFGSFLQQYQPDLIHFFHLGRLSSSAIETGHTHGIPMIFTATDFWMVCPTNQLRLPDGSMCLGPDTHSINCIRHIAAATQSQEINSKVERLSDTMLAGLAWGTRRSWWPEKQYSPLVSSLTKRIGFQKRTMNLMERVIVPTRLMKGILLNNGLNPGKLIHQHYGINLESVEGHTPKTPDSVLRLGFIGTLYEHKGAHVLIEAISLLDSNADVCLKIYGSLTEFPDYVSRLRELANDDPRIELCGTFPNSSIGEVFSKLDVLIVPSIWYENAPLVVYSAQSTHTPVVATDLGGLSEIINHDENGLLFEKGNAHDLATQIMRLINEPGLVQKLGQNAKEPKSIPTYVDELEEIYNDALSERKKYS